MPNEVLCDNDVILKCSCCDLSLEALVCVSRVGSVLILGSAVYVVADRIRRSSAINDKKTAKENFEVFVEYSETVEPTHAEVTLAAEFETAAQRANLALDAGESLLLAVLISRNTCSLLLTGDKRAIEAMERLGSHHQSAAQVADEVACLEQLFMALVQTEDVDVLQRRVCRERGVDVALSNCFSCTSGQYTIASIRQGLRSYATAVRKQAPRVFLNADSI